MHVNADQVGWICNRVGGVRRPGEHAGSDDDRAVNVLVRRRRHRDGRHGDEGPLERAVAEPRPGGEVGEVHTHEAAHARRRRRRGARDGRTGWHPQVVVHGVHATHRPIRGGALDRERPSRAARGAGTQVAVDRAVGPRLVMPHVEHVVLIVEEHVVPVTGGSAARHERPASGRRLRRRPGGHLAAVVGALRIDRPRGAHGLDGAPARGRSGRRAERGTVGGERGDPSLRELHAVDPDEAQLRGGELLRQLLRLGARRHHGSLCGDDARGHAGPRDARRRCGDREVVRRERRGTRDTAQNEKRCRCRNDPWQTHAGTMCAPAAPGKPAEAVYADKG